MTVLEKSSLTITELERFAERLATSVKAGDCLLLEGDLGAGKSTFARALIRAIAQNPELEVPSPTFPLLIPYETGRYKVNHFDLYRISDLTELEELGLYDDLATHLTIIEWPDENLKESIKDHLTLRLTEAEGGNSRYVSLEGSGTLKKQPARLKAIEDFLDNIGWLEAEWAYLQGDASSRSYIRLNKGNEARLLMNAPPQPDGPPIKDGKPYSQIAHLSEDMTSFVAVSRALSAYGLKAPVVENFDIKTGLLLISDFGNQQYYDLITTGKADHEALYNDAIDVLVELRSFDPDKLGGAKAPGDPDYQLPLYDEVALQIEADLTIDWYWPYNKDAEISSEDREAWHQLWRPLLAEVQSNSNHWALRDFHSPNLMRLGGEGPLQRVGIIDFQDALKGHAAYDVVSLCQDARLTVPEVLEERLVNRYINAITESDDSFNKDEFLKAYAILGAQRASKLLGIFVRLAVRDGKQHYLAHLPRIWDYLERNLKHPALSELADWFQHHFPGALRETAASPACQSDQPSAINQQEHLGNQ